MTPFNIIDFICQELFSLPVIFFDALLAAYLFRATIFALDVSRLCFQRAGVSQFLDSTPPTFITTDLYCQELFFIAHFFFSALLAAYLFRAILASTRIDYVFNGPACRQFLDDTSPPYQTSFYLSSFIFASPSFYFRVPQNGTLNECRAEN